jgi:hypothetical protein
VSTLRRMLAAPAAFEPSIAAVRSPVKRVVTRAYIVMAAWQKAYGDRHIDEWRPPPASSPLDVEVITLASERDRAELMRMVHSFLTHVGTPASLVIVSDGTLSRDTAAHVCRLSSAIEVRSLEDYATDPPLHPIVPRLLTGEYPLGAKVPLLLASVTNRLRLYLDTDIEFFRGAHRLRAMISDGERRPRFTRQRDGQLSSYDARMIEGVSLTLGVNSGFCLLKDTPDWSLALDRLGLVIDDPHVLSEQTAFAIAMSESNGLPLSVDDFVLDWDDLGVPWDSYARRDIVMRHYASPSRRWKLWMRGGPRGARTLPRAAYEYAALAGDD